jgi:Rod binding domain-containing protein
MGPISSAVTAAATPGHSGAQPRLVRAAHEFEAQMLKELLQPIAKSSGLLGDEDGSGEGSGGVLGQFAAEAFAGALSSQGGFGIARQIVRDLSHSGNQSATTPVIGNLQIDTGMRRGK